MIKRYSIVWYLKYKCVSLPTSIHQGKSTAMNIKKLLLLLTALLTLMSMNAQQVSEQEALAKAQQFFGQANKTNASRNRAPRKAPELTLANNRSEFYVFNDEANGGYVVISGDERMPDVLAYSDNGHFDAGDMPCNMKAWMEEYAEQVKYLRAHPEAKVRKRTATERENIGPLLTCWFYQGTNDGRGYYNLKCPKVGDLYCYTGCVPTAMAQIMYYYQWPKQTTDVIPGYITESYEFDILAIPITTIDWDNMLSEYNSRGNYTQKQIDAISTLMLLCGTSVQVDYGLVGSGGSASAAARALRHYWGYDDLLEEVRRNDYGTEEWEQLMYDELKDGRPILYSGRPEDSYSGHTFVLDGYVDGYFHVNWGWGGAESYVLMTDDEGWREYVEGHHGVIGIQPVYPDSPHRYAVFNNGTMTFYYDNKKTERSRTILQNVDEFPNFIQSSNYAEEITECVIDPSYADVKQRDLNQFFAGWKNLKTIQGIENLNTTKARNMELMFFNCQNLESLDLSSFKTDNVTNMREMFIQCYNLRSLDVSGFKTDNVTTVSGMFYGCKSLTNLDVSNFKTDRVTNMSNMFCYCSSLTSLDVSNFKTDNVTNLSLMFVGCSSLTSLDLSNFKTDNVTDMERMFSGCSGLTNLDLSNFRTDNVTDMNRMFEDCSGLTNLDVSGFNTEKVTNMYKMFFYCPNLTSLDVSGFNTENVTDMSWMFAGCDSLRSLDVSRFETDNVTSMERMFAGCYGLRSLDVSGFNTNNVTDMKFMFSNCDSLTNLDVSGFNTDKVTDMRWMFNGCESLTSLDVSHFKTDNVTSMERMFTFCSGLTSLDLSGFKTDNVINMKYMFSNCPNLSTIYVSELWNMSNVEESGDMFYLSPYIVGGAGTVFDENHTDGEYARVDGGPDNPGYFTYKEIPDAIGAITSDLHVARVYDLQGKRRNNVRKGLNIVVMSDGTVKKVMIK